MRGKAPDKPGPGRPKGSINLVNKEVRIWLKDAMEGHGDMVKKTLVKLYNEDPKAYIDALSKLLPYITPKMKEVEHKIPDLSKFSNDELLVFSNLQDKLYLETN